ncbi:hypothetical protein ACNFJ7_00660 [Sphingomonas sp. HT-1]|uniref:hypothetical protein n=1 Tax=unclassified Sphingomonas TaxID=196159 RepID=UPI0012EA99C0|nr:MULTISPECIES: hypothetical protein [unclassified Sphingomonas]
MFLNLGRLKLLPVIGLASINAGGVPTSEKRENAPFSYRYNMPVGKNPLPKVGKIHQ